MYGGIKMEENQMDNLYKLLDKIEAEGKNPLKIKDIRDSISEGNYIDALQKINSIDDEDEYEDDFEENHNHENRDQNAK